MLENIFQAQSGLDVERTGPWLLPYNRRLRHLKSISIRNLSASTSSTRRLSAALDDEALPQSRSTPAKLLSKQEHGIEQSRSSTDLTSIRETIDVNGQSAKANGKAVEPPLSAVRPSARRLRRRSTLDWVHASPMARQKRLEKITYGQLLDVFCTLHLDDQEQPIYLSEIMHQTTNPTFERVELLRDDLFSIACDDFKLKSWTRSDDGAKFECLLELRTRFSNLHFLCWSLDQIKRPLPQNCVLFHMSDGIFVAADDPLTSPPPSLAVKKQSGQAKPLLTSSYDALMRLSNLEISVRNALATRRRLETEINELLDNNRDDLTTVSLASSVEDSLVSLEHAKNSEQRRLDSVTRRREQLKAGIEKRKRFMKAEGKVMESEKHQMMAEGRHVAAMKEALSQTGKDITNQRRRICRDLQFIYPIDHTAGQNLAFTIRSLPLPNSNFDGTDDAVVAAALGHVAQLIHYLSFYLAAPLPYPPSPRGSTSTIADPISATPTNASSAIYPLYSRGIPRFRFEYAVFLLNKDIQLLAARASLRLVDIRHTLPNLKYLLCVAASQGTKTETSKSANVMRTFLRETSMLRNAS